MTDTQGSTQTPGPNIKLGPWKVKEQGEYWEIPRVIEAGSGAEIASHAVGWPKADMEAHIQLLAAAPELLDALREISRWSNDYQDGSSETMREATRAIADLSRAAVEKVEK